MRHSQAWFLALVASVAAGVLALALLPGAPRAEAEGGRADPEVGGPGALALRTADRDHPADSSQSALEPAPSAARASALPAPPAPPPGRIAGRVLGGRSSREPLAGARVRLRLGLHEPIQAVEATTDAQGRFACAGLRTGGWFVDVLAPDHERDARVVRLQPEAPAAEVELCLPMSRTFDARAVDERGLPLEFARLGLAREFAKSVRIGVLRADDGRGPRPGDKLHLIGSDGSRRGEEELAWDLERALLAGQLVVLCVGDRVAACARVPATGDALQLVVEEATIPLLTRDLDFVVTASAAPLAGATVSLTHSWGGTATRSTDAEGRARIAGVPYERLALRVEADALPTHSSWMDADRIETTRLDLPPARTIAGRILCERVAPDARVRVGLWRVDDVEEPLRGSCRSAESELDGSFAFAEMPPGTYVLAATSAIRRGESAGRVRRGEVSGATWIDVRSLDAVGLALEVGVLDELRPGTWRRPEAQAGRSASKPRR